MVLVALAGPATNIPLALMRSGAASLPFRAGGGRAMDFRQSEKRYPYQCRAGGLQHDADTAAGRRAGRGRYPAAGAGLPLARLEPFGMLILIALLILLPLRVRSSV